MMQVLIDTSVWVEYFRERNRTLCDRVEQLIIEERACCNGVVLGELLYGARGPREAEEIRKAMLSLSVLVDVPGVFAEAGQMGADLRRTGVTVPLTDCVLAAQARRAGLTVLTADGHFTPLAERFGFVLDLVPTAE